MCIKIFVSVPFSGLIFMMKGSEKQIKWAEVFPSPTRGLVFNTWMLSDIVRNFLRFPSPVRGLVFQRQGKHCRCFQSVSVPCFGLRFLLQDYVAQIRNLQRVSVPCSGLSFSKAWYDVKQGKEPQIFPSPTRGLFFQTNVNFWWQHYSKAFPSPTWGLFFYSGQQNHRAAATRGVSVPCSRLIF